MESNICVGCKWYAGDRACYAFAEIPTKYLSGEEFHEYTDEEQVGDYVYTPKDTENGKV